MDRDGVHGEMRMFVVGALADIQATDDIREALHRG